MDDDRVKWDRRYGEEGFFLGPHPSSFLVENLGLIGSICPGKQALDIACGEGRNSIFLARHGFSVTGLDISSEGIAKAKRWAEAEELAIEFLTADLEVYEFDRSWDLIININFLLRDLLAKGVAALTPRGVMVVDTILDTPSLPGGHTKAFLLQPGELPRLFSSFPGNIHLYEEHPLDSAPTAKLIFQRAE